MRFVIMGYDKRYETRKSADIYGRFDNRAECYKYLNFLKTGCLGEIITFFVKELDADGRSLEGHTGV